MNEKNNFSAEELLEKINQAAQRMKHAKAISDKIGYDIALKEYERLHKEYAHLLYTTKEPSKVYHRRM